MFELGQKVVCVKTHRLHHPKVRSMGPDRLIYGNIYTVTQINVGPNSGLTFLRLAEYPHPDNTMGCRAEYFRPFRANESEAREQWQQMLSNPQQVDA